MFFDLHNDFPTVIDKHLYKDYISACGGTVTSVIWTSEMGDSAYDRVREIVSALFKAADTPVSIEDIGFMSDDALEDFDFSSFFYCSLTWNHNNRFAGGALDDGELTEKGRRAIARMNGVCAVDLAHLNRKSFFQVLELAQKPLCSHTGFAPHPRSLDSEMISMLIARGGVIGLCAVTAFTGAATVNELCDVIDSFVQHYGINSLCLGTDFNGTTDLPQDFKDYSNIHAVRDGLNKKGYADKDIDKILFGNALRFYEELKFGSTFIA